MTSVLVELLASSDADADQLCSAIQAAGALNFTNNEGNTVNVAVGSVSVKQ